MLSTLKKYSTLASLGGDCCQSLSISFLWCCLKASYCAVQVFRLVEEGGETELTLCGACLFPDVGLNKSWPLVLFQKPPRIRFGNIYRQDRVSQEKFSDTKLLMRASWLFWFLRAWGYECLTSGGYFASYGNGPFWRPEISSLQSLHLDPIAHSLNPRIKPGLILSN